MIISEEDYIEHVGVKGMKWGVRRGKSKSGVGRVKGAALDRNQRVSARIDRRQRGKGTIRDRTAKKAANVVLGKETAAKYYDYRMNYLKGQKNRIDKGKTNVLDKAQTFSLLYVNPASLVISSTHGNKGRLADKFG